MNDEFQRRERILNIILMGSIVMLTILDVIVLFYSLKEGPHYKEISFGQFSLLPIFFSLLYLLSRKGYSLAASYLLVGGYFLSNTYAAYRWGVMLQVVILAYALIIIMATILRGTKFGFFVTTAIATIIIPLWYAQYKGIISIQKQQLRSADGIVFAVLYFLIMIVAWLYNREIENSLKRARQSEKELKAQKDVLEIKVYERTQELQKAQFEKLEQVNRFAELGHLSSGLFHDIFNLLSALSLRSEKDSNESMPEVISTTKQIENFTQAIRKQLAHQPYEEQFSLIQSIGHVIQLLNYKATKEHVCFVMHNPDDSEFYHFDTPFKFHQIILNLLLNAIESFETLPAEDKRNRVISITAEEKNGYAIITIKDNGSGMTTETREKIFEQFFTTKSASKGTGIGLTTVKKILEKELHGNISVISEIAIGSIFTLTFPINNGSIPEDNRTGPEVHKRISTS